MNFPIAASKSLNIAFLLYIGGFAKGRTPTSSLFLALEKFLCVLFQSNF